MSRWRKIILVTTFSVLATLAEAQTASTVKTDTDSLSYRNPFFSLYPKVVRGKQTLSNTEAAFLFEQVPAAGDYYRKYRHQYKTGLYAFGTVFVFISASALSFQKGNKGLTGATILLSLGSFVTATIFAAKGEANLKRAINTYNRQVVHY